MSRLGSDRRTDGRTDGLGLIEIYSTLGNQELYIHPRARCRRSYGHCSLPLRPSRCLSNHPSRTPYYPELRLIDTRLPAVIYISRVI